MITLLDGFLKSTAHRAHRPALELQNQRWSYQALYNKAATLAEAIEAVNASASPMVGIAADRTLWAYAGILATLGTSQTFVPVHPSFPVERQLDIIERTGLSTLVVDDHSIDHLPHLLDRIARSLSIIAPGEANLSALIRRFPTHRFISQSSLTHCHRDLEPTRDPEALAYILFTSGSTGRPKGVPITHLNATTYLHHIQQSFRLDPTDRVSHTFKLAFDLSIHDLFSTWQAGACLVPLSPSERLAPGRFIRQKELTRWFSVPTAAMTMERLGQLQPSAFPSLKSSLFCGEALPARIASAWSRAAPNSTIHNLYGPTEATIAITDYQWRPQDTPQQCLHGIVPIGRAFPTQRTRVVGTDGRPTVDGQPGELWLAGSQLSPGYWQDPEKTEAAFVRVDGHRWYRTGDLVERDPKGCLHYRGRLDHQVQIQGHRVELPEVDHHLRAIVGHPNIVAILWPYADDAPRGLVAVLAPPPEGSSPSDAAILKDCKQRLPRYMVPRSVHRVDAFPTNSSGKIDRRALQQLLDQRGTQ